MIPLFKVGMSGDASARVAETLQSGYIGQGPRVEEFESALRKELGIQNLLTVNSGTSALHLALHLLKRPASGEGFHGIWPGIQPGDEVLATPLTCTATNWPVLGNGLELRWVDVDPNNANMSLDDLKQKLSSRTKVILLVHWGGYPVDLDALGRILDEATPHLGFSPMVIEDCAHAWKSTYKNRFIGSHGNLAAFSFQAIKHLTCGDGGLLVTPNTDLFKRGKLLRWYGIDRDDPRGDFRCENDVPEWGFKFHMNDISATIGLSNLEFADIAVEQHRDNAKFYNSVLQNTPGVELLENATDRLSSYRIYTIKVSRREDFRRKLSESGIMVSQVHERNDKHSTVESYRSFLTQLDSIIDKIICIPVGWWVDEIARNHIADTIKSGW